MDENPYQAPLVADPPLQRPRPLWLSVLVVIGKVIVVLIWTFIVMCVVSMFD